MARFSQVRPLAAVATAPFCALFFRSPVKNEEKKDFKALTCTKNEPHTHNTRKITLDCGNTLNSASAIVNVLVKAPVVGSSCCGCCKCGPNCSCPKKPSGCCACCSCPDLCKCPKAKKGETVRPYNPISLSEGGALTLLVKKYENALMGTYIHDLAVGETIEVKGPNQQWKLEKGKYSKYGMIAGGTGITPLIQAAGHILANDTAKVTMVCLNKSVEDMLLVDELAALQRKYPGRLHVEHVVETKPEGSPKFSPPRAGTASVSMLKWLLPSPASDVLVLVCGPKAMTDTVAGPKAADFSQGELAGYLKELGYKAEGVRKV